MSGTQWTSDQVCEMTGITYRQLDYWVRTKMVTPSVYDGLGSGGLGRRWSDMDVRQVRVVAALMRWAPGRNRNPDPIGRIIRLVTSELPQMTSDSGYLVVGDEGVSWAADVAQLGDAIGEHSPSCWVLDLGALATSVPARRSA